MSEEIASAAGDIAYWQRRAEAAERKLSQAQEYITRLRRWGSRLLLAIDRYPQLIPIYASALRWRIEGPPVVMDDELWLMPLVGAAYRWRDALQGPDGVADAEQALLAELAALHGKGDSHGQNS